MTTLDLFTLAESQHVPLTLEFHPGHEPGKPRGYIGRMGDVETPVTLRLKKVTKRLVAAMMARNAALADELARRDEVVIEVAETPKPTPIVEVDDEEDD